MADNTDLLDRIRQVVREEIAPIQATQKEQGKQLTHLQTGVIGMKSDIATLKSDVSTLKTEVAVMKGEVAKIPGMQQQLSNLELNVEAFRVEQRHANEGLLTHVISGYDESAKTDTAIENRVDRIEKHLNLPPVR